MKVKLCEAFELQMGKTPSRNEPSLWNGIHKWVSIGDLSQADKYIIDTKECISDEGVIKSGIKIVPKNTVVMSFKLSIGKAAITAEDMYTNEAIMAFIDKKKCQIDSNYLYYLFCGLDWTEGTNKAVMGLTLNKATMSQKEIYIPPIKQQAHVTTVLDKISDLIALRKQQLAKLDELIKARFVEMFGDESKFNKWPCCSVGDVADVCVGVVIKPTQYYAEQGVPAFRSLNIGNMSVRDNDWVYFTEEGHRKNQKSVVRENDILVIRSGAPGTACVAGKKYAGYNAVDIIIAHPDAEKVNPTFLAMFTNMPHGMQQIKEKTGGAAQQHFNVGGYKSIKMINPPLFLQNEFSDFFAQVDKCKLTIQQGLDKLEMLKKALMQEYFG